MRSDYPVGRYIGMVHRCLRSFMRERVEPLGIPEPALPYLLRLFHKGEVTQDELTRAHHGDKATAARALGRLETAGLVTRWPDPQDRRLKRVRLTDKARELEPQVQAAFSAWNVALTAGMDPDESRQAQELLARMAANAREAAGLEECCGRSPAGSRPAKPHR